MSDADAPAATHEARPPRPAPRTVPPGIPVGPAPLGPGATYRPPAGMLALLVGFAATGGALVTLLGWLGPWWWGFGLLEHFRVQYAVGLGAVALVALGRRAWRSLAVAALAAGVNVLVIAPAWAPRPAVPPHGAALRVVTLNVEQDNPDHARVARFLAEADADVVALLEVDSAWLRDLALGARYPYAFADPHDHDRFGLAIFSRRPLHDARVRMFGVRWPPAIVARLDADGGEVTLVLVHPPPPVSAAMAEVSERFLAALSAERATLGEHVVVLGDFNATPWSSGVRRILAHTELRDSRRGFGLGASWPSATWALRIPIDQVLVSRRVVVLERRVGPEVGSDHLPVRVTLALRAAP